MKKTNRKTRTTIQDLSTTGFELVDTQLRLVSGGLPRQCWQASASVTEPGQVDTAKDLVDD